MPRTAARRKTTTITPEEYAAQIADLTKRLKEFSDSTDSETQAEYAARFPLYSPRNAMLIVMQKPDATMVQSMRTWNLYGRRIRKGEHGIRIVCPAGKRDVPTTSADAPDSDNGKNPARQLFKIAYVFDISQTE